MLHATELYDAVDEGMIALFTPNASPNLPRRTPCRGACRLWLGFRDGCARDTLVNRRSCAGAASELRCAPLSPGDAIFLRIATASVSPEKRGRRCSLSPADGAASSLFAVPPGTAAGPAVCDFLPPGSVV